MAFRKIESTDHIYLQSRSRTVCSFEVLSWISSANCFLQQMCTGTKAVVPVFILSNCVSICLDKAFRCNHCQSSKKGFKYGSSVSRTYVILYSLYLFNILHSCCQKTKRKKILHLTQSFFKSKEFHPHLKVNTPAKRCKFLCKLQSA